MARIRNKKEVKRAAKNRLSKRKRNAPNAYAYAFYAALAIIVVFAIAFASEYESSSILNKMLTNPYLAYPPIRFYVGVPVPASASNLTMVSPNQIFCPENATIKREAAESFSYGYYTVLKPGEEFNISFASNSSKAFSYAYVYPPFSLVSYSYIYHNTSLCAGYPNAKYSFNVKIRAPESYIGPIPINLYK